MRLLSLKEETQDNGLLWQSHRVEDAVSFLLAGDGDRAVLVLDGEQGTFLVQVNGVAAAKCHGVAP